ncbi:MAG: hypothetical protein U0996_26415 [Planctomycetaceae bacterium]
MESRQSHLHSTHTAADGDYFVCPGQNMSVSRSIHLARLNAAWPVCDGCEWRFHTEGLNEKTVVETTRIREHRRQGIQRTEFGIRGPYLNALHRRMAEELVRIFCQCLVDRSTVQGSLQRPESKEIQPERLSLAPVVIGFDGRSSSPDIFVGVSSSIREFGLPVIDLGRSTAASLQEALRCLPESCGGILVTGAGCPNSWTGLDVFDRSGDSVPVVWKDFGIRLQHPGLESSDTPSTASLAGYDTDVPDEMSHRLQQIRSAKMLSENEGRGAVRSDAVRTSLAPRTAGILQLVLPEPDQRSSWPRRMTRHSGALTLVDFEDRYRDWLSRWYPREFEQRVIVETNDQLIRQRVLWLAESQELCLIPRSTQESQAADDALTIRVDDDDRFFAFHRASGLQINAGRLADSLNRAIASHASHITVHADDVSGRFWLTDAARPSLGLSTEQIHDALAVIGLVCRLASAGRLQLQEL